MFAATTKRVLTLLAIALVLGVALMNSAAVRAAENDGNYYYQAKSGDSLTSIAKMFGMTLEKVMLANPQIKDPNLILSGQVITIPAGRAETLLANGSAHGRLIHWQLERQGQRIERSDHYYLVKNGDTLTGIAKKYGVSLEKLLSVNPQIDDQNKLYRGELVKIPEGRSESRPTLLPDPAGYNI